jgi:hypothetical protein
VVPPATLRVDLSLGLGADAEELDVAACELLSALRTLDVESAERAALGALVLEPGGGAQGPIANVLQCWLGRRCGRAVKLTVGADSIEICGGSPAYQRQLIETFLTAP